MGADCSEAGWWQGPDSQKVREKPGMENYLSSWLWVEDEAERNLHMGKSWEVSCGSVTGEREHSARTRWLIPIICKGFLRNVVRIP